MLQAHPYLRPIQPPHPSPFHAFPDHYTPPINTRTSDRADLVSSVSAAANQALAASSVTPLSDACPAEGVAAAPDWPQQLLRPKYCLAQQQGAVEGCSGDLGGQACDWGAETAATGAFLLLSHIPMPAAAACSLTTAFCLRGVLSLCCLCRLCVCLSPLPFVLVHSVCCCCRGQQQ